MRTMPNYGEAELGGAEPPRATLHPAGVLAATVLGSSLAFIDGSVVNVALPALARDLGVGAAGLSWTIDAYLLPVGALTLLGGAAGDRFGRRRLFFLGLLLFLLASLLCALAPSLGWLLAGRGVQGIGAAFLMPNSLAILGTGFIGEARGRAVGTWAAAGALTGALGPLIGGWLVDIAGWRTIFLINLPIGMAAGYLGWAYVHESRDQRTAANLDWSGALAATAALGLLTWSLTAVSEAPVTTATALTSVVGALLLALFVRIEYRRGERALMPLKLLAAPGFLGLTLLTFFLYASLGGLVVLLPFLLIHSGGYSAVEAGAAMLPLPIMIALGSRVTGGAAVRVGARNVLGSGSLLVAAGFTLYARIDTGALAYRPDILPGTMLVALGMGLVVAPLTTAVMASVDADRVGVASGFNSAVARIAGLVATALAGFVFALADNAAAFVAAARIAALIGAATAVVAAGCALLVKSPSQPVS